MPCAGSWLFCAVLMYFQLGRVQTYTDFRVWRNNYGILIATNLNPVMVPHSAAVTDRPQCTASCSMAVACSQRLLT